MRLLQTLTSKISGGGQRTLKFFGRYAIGLNPHPANTKVVHSAIAKLGLVAALGVLVIGGTTIASASIAPYHSVTLHENDSLSDSVIVDDMNNAAAPLTLFASLSPAFVNPGYTFASWNTSAFGNGIQYLDGSVYNFAAGSADLYAQWVENSVTFYENATGSDSKSAMQSANTLQALTTFANLSPSFSDPGYVFAGWTTNANGTGTSYANGANYDFENGDLTLYAQWAALPTEMANFSAAAGSGTVSPLSGIQGTEVSLPSGTGLSYPGFTFTGWNTASNGTGTSYLPGSEFVLASDVTLYAQWVPNTVTFYENASGSDATHASQSASVISALTLLAELTPSFSNPGYTFSGWATNPNGSGTLYANGASYDFLNGSGDLYAQWAVIPTDVVNFNANGGTGTGAQVSGLQGSSATLPGADAFTRTGYTFDGWNTLATGSGTSYAAGASLSLSESLTLYAQWTPDVFDVTYVANGGSVNPSATTFVVDSAALVLPTPTYAGHAFTGWFSAATGGTSAGVGGGAYTPTDSVTLYAQWTADTYLVTFDASPGTVSPTSSSFQVGSSPISLPTPTNGNSLFLGWYDAASGGSLVGAAGAAYSPTASTTVYAQWQAAVMYTLSFDANGGTGSIAPITAAPGTNVTVPGVAGLSRPGYTLVKWSTAKNGSGASYASGSIMSLVASTTLYAQWSGHALAVVLGGVGPFAGRSTALTAAMRKQISRFATLIKSHHYATVSLYGYAANTGLVSLNKSISARRAQAVAVYLRSRLAALKVKATIKPAGEGTVAGAATTNSRVEVIAQ